MIVSRYIYKKKIIVVLCLFAASTVLFRTFVGPVTPTKWIYSFSRVGNNVLGSKLTIFDKKDLKKGIEGRVTLIRKHDRKTVKTFESNVDTNNESQHETKNIERITNSYKDDKFNSPNQKGTNARRIVKNSKPQFTTVKNTKNLKHGNKIAKNDKRNKTWWDILPQYRHLLKARSMVQRPPTAKQFTSPSKSEFKILDQTPLKTGGILKGVIHAKDYYGNLKQYGGDIFQVMVTPSNSPNDGVMCDLEDNLNGTYNTLCPLLWEGEFKIKAVLIFPSDTAYLHINITEGPRQVFGDFTYAVTNSTGGKENVTCNLQLTPEYKSSEICDFSGDSPGEEWFCVKPSDGYCGEIAFQYKPDRWRQTFPFGDATKYFRYNHDHYELINGSGMAVHVDGEAVFRQQRGELRKCSEKLGPKNRKLNFGVDSLSYQGFFHNDTWYSVTCVNTDEYFNDLGKMKKCLTNKTLFFIGDSTVRQWKAKIYKTLNIEWNSTALPERGYLQENNFTLLYQRHGRPFFGTMAPHLTVYAPNTLSKIKFADENFVLVISIGLHLNAVNPKFFTWRIQTWKMAILKLKHKFPKINIYVKEVSNYIQIGYTPFQFDTYRYNLLLRNVFGDVPEVTYIPLWDMTSLRVANGIHPPDEMVDRQIALFLSYLCQ